MRQNEISDYIKLFSLPILAYVIFIAVRLMGFQPESEGEIGDMLTAISFLFGAFIAYFVYILVILNKPDINNESGLWWWCMSLLLITIALDELFMIHENLGEYLQINDTLIFLVYALILGILLLFKLKDTFKKSTFNFLLAFSFFTVVSQGADYFFNEGIITLFNRDISYEQLMESLAALCLSSAVVTIAIRYISLNEKFPDKPE